jgi:hypothetical protein
MGLVVPHKFGFVGLSFLVSGAVSPSLPANSRYRPHPVVDAGNPAIADAYREVADFLLLDSHEPGDGQIGALRRTHDWRLSRTIVDRVPMPVILAGGLGPDNVAAAIAAVGPAGVDSKTRTDRADGPGKDLDAVGRFVAAAKAARLTSWRRSPAIRRRRCARPCRRARSGTAARLDREEDRICRLPHGTARRTPSACRCRPAVAAAASAGRRPAAPPRSTRRRPQRLNSAAGGLFRSVPGYICEVSYLERPTNAYNAFSIASALDTSYTPGCSMLSVLMTPLSTSIE